MEKDLNTLKIKAFDFFGKENESLHCSREEYK